MAGKNLTKKHISSKIIAIVITAFVSILTVTGAYVLNKNNSNLTQINQDISKVWNMKLLKKAMRTLIKQTMLSLMHTS